MPLSRLSGIRDLPAWPVSDLVVECLGRQLARAPAGEHLDGEHGREHEPATKDHPRRQRLPAERQTAKNAANTGSIVMTIAARVAGMCACAQVCTQSARMLAKTTM